MIEIIIVTGIVATFIVLAGMFLQDVSEQS